MPSSISILALLSTANAAAISTIVTTITTSTPPDYFQTTPELYPGPTATGPEPFLVQTNEAPFDGISYIPPQPLETQQPIKNKPEDDNIFRHLANINPYYPSPGFGVDEYPLPEGAEVVWLNMLSRHGSRYPTEAIPLGEAIADASNASFTGELSFLNQWEFVLGNNILNPVGRQELYDSGVLHNYKYGHLYDPESSEKILVRTTTQDRMRKSAENFLAGFFGLNYADDAKLLFILENEGFNNSLTGYKNCPNNNNFRSSAGDNASTAWIEQSTTETVSRLNALSNGFTWNSTLVNYAQQLCSYETVGLGYSHFCPLFTYPEWLDFEYSIDLSFTGHYGYQSPTGRAVGAGYVSEVLAKMTHHLLTTPTGSSNTTLNAMNSTFPTSQRLNLDFTHEVNIISILTAFSLTQFAPPLDPTRRLEDRNFITSHLTPFGARLDIEIIRTPHPVPADRSSPTPGSQQQYHAAGGETHYVHFVLNQRTLPLGESLAGCGRRADGWCEMGAFLEAQEGVLEKARFEEACFGDYEAPVYGGVVDGAPPST